MQDVDEETQRLLGKVEILPGHAADLSACTFVIREEDHTLGNALRYMIMKNPHVEFCGYSAPHPSEYKIHLRIQMYDRKSALDALVQALDNLEELFSAVKTTYEEALQSDDIARPAPAVIDWEDVRRRAVENKRLGLLPGSGGKGGGEGRPPAVPT